MKEFLDRIKDQIREFLREVRENNKGNRTELILTGLFILVFLALSVPDLAKEASGGRVLETESEAVQETKEQLETGSEESETDTDGMQSPVSDTEESGSGTDQSELMADNSGQKESDEEEAGKNETEEASSSSGEATEEVSSSSGEVVEEASGSSSETTEEAGSTAADETERSSEPGGTTEETLSQELLDRQWKRLQAQYGETFLFPMAAADDSGILPLPELKNTMQLRGYDAVLQWKPEKTIQNLKQQLEKQIAGYDGEWSVYCKNLSTEESFVINDTPMKSASVMKLFIMGTVYTAFENGELTRTDEILSLLNNMIIYSDNSASNELLSKLGNGSYADGIAKVDAFIQSHGFSSMTVEYNGFNDPATNTSSDHFNQVAAKDCGKLLEDIYRRTWVNRRVSNEMESLLLSQDTRYKIPAGLPEGVLCGNKTGEMDTTENDAAIIYGKDCDYILVVLSSDWGSKDQAISRIAELSRITYQYLNPETDTAE